MDTMECMRWFQHGHATHPDWRIATELVAAQLQGQAKDSRYASSDTGQLGVLYITLAYAEHFQAIADLLKERTGIAQWVGTLAPMIVATGVEYVNEPALSALLIKAPADSIRVFSGRDPIPGLDQTTESGAWLASAALVHADAYTPELEGVIRDMTTKTRTGHVVGGIGSGVSDAPTGSRPQLANRVVQGGVSGAVFASDIPLLTKLTQGCTPLGKEHRVSKAQGNYLQALNDSPALDVLLADLDVDAEVRQSTDGNVLMRAFPREKIERGLLLGTAPATSPDYKPRPGDFSEFIIRQIVGIDPVNRIVATAAQTQKGDRLVFCTRNERSARADLLRLCSELRDELDEAGKSIRGAIYISCTGRGKHSFGAASAEVQLIHSQLGEFPLCGFFANGEIYRDKLYGFTGVLTVFTN